MDGDQTPPSSTGIPPVCAALDALDDHIAVVDAQGLIIFVNAAWRRFGAANGAPASQSDVGRSYIEICEAAGDPSSLAAAQGLRELFGGARDELMLEYPCPSQAEMRWFRLRGTTFRAQGATYALISHRDMTRAVRSEELRRDSEERYHLIWQATNDCMALSDPEGVVLDVNPAYFRLYGGTPEEVIGASFARIFPPDVQAWAEQSYRETFWSQPAGRLYESNVRHDSGDERIVESRIDFVERDGRRIGMLSVVRDITDHKRIEATLREQEALFRLIFEQSPLGAALVGLDYRFLRVNAAFCRMTGYSAEELLSMNFPSITHPDDLDADLAQARLLGEGAIDQYTLEKRYLQRGGQVFWGRLTGCALRDEAGVARFFLAQIEDVTEQRQVAEQRQKIELQIQEGQRLESIGVLAGGIAHDFNNMLTGIRGHAELALMDIPAEHASCYDLQQVLAGVQQVGDLTQQLLVYAGKSKLAARPLVLNEVITAMADLLKVATARQAELRYDLAGELPPIEADVAQIRQVALNLITNAVDALGGGPGLVRVATRSLALSRAELDTMLMGADLAPGPYISLSVADSGAGMDAATLARIFEPFYTTKSTGRGLGLASVQGIIRRHRAALTVDTALGEGTTFTVYFPAIAHAAPAPGLARPGAELSSAQGAVLVIDDDMMVRNITARMITRIGYTAVSAESGAAGLAILDARHDDLVAVLVDLTMPQPDGEAVAKEIWRRFPELPVVLMSGYSATSIAERAAALNFAGVLQKPFSQDDLRLVLAERLARS